MNIFNGRKVLTDKEIKLQDDLQENLESTTNLTDSQIARAKKIARNGRDAVVMDNGSVMDEAYSV